MAGERLDWQGNLVAYRRGPEVPTGGSPGGLLVDSLCDYWCDVCGLERHHWAGCPRA